jgi:hypothetical protein
MPQAPEIRRGPAEPGQLPFGAAQALNQAMEATHANQAQTSESPMSRAPQQGRRPIPTRQAYSQSQEPGSFGDLEDVVLGPSDRPDEPITAGANFGPGQMFVAPDLTPDQRLRVTARAVVRTQDMDPRAIAFFTRVLNGE